ncbi:MAG: hypothetical protein ACREH4_09180 [Vitreimonas sp.]
MSGAQSWSVKGIDPKVREAAREAAERQGVSLGEYLNQALTNDDAPAPPEPQSVDLVAGDEAEESAAHDPARLARRVESIERRTQLAVTGLDRAVSTIDRSVLGLAARIEDAEAVSGEAAGRIAQALEQFRIAGETMSGRLERAEREAADSRSAMDGAASEFGSVKERLEHQASIAEEVARRAEAAASLLTTEMESRDAVIVQTLAEARAVAEEAARQASEASADAVNELRRLQEEMSDRLVETETSTRRAIETAISEVRSETSSEHRGTREALLEEVVRLEGEIARRVGTADQLMADHTALIARIERAEAGSRESTAGLRQAAGAAIADLRNAQLTLAARVKQVEDVAGASGALDLAELRQAQQDIAERLISLEDRATANPVADALAAFEHRLAGIETGGDKLDQVDGAVKSLDRSLQRLAERIAETESTANTAIRTLEEAVSSLGARVEQNVPETEAFRAMLEQRLDTMAQSVSQMVGEARQELAGQLQAALDGQAGEGLEGALADVNRRLAAADRRQAQTIEAISLEIKRMSETVDKRLRAVEARNDDAAASAVREELSRMAATLEQRFDDIERRETAAFDRMGLEVGRLSERLEERVGAVETRSAQAIEHVGEQVARMAERFSQRHETLSRELGDRMLDSEERASSRVAEAIGSIMQRLAEVEEHAQEAIAPVQKAVSNVASKLDQFESARSEAIPAPARRFEDFADFGPGLSDTEPQPYVSPMDAAQPTRAAPLAPTATPNAAPVLRQTPEEPDVYLAGDFDDLLINEQAEIDTQQPPDAFERPQEDVPVDAPELDAFEPTATPQDDDTFWTPGSPSAATPSRALGEDDDRFDAALAQPPAPEPASSYEPPPPSMNDYLASARRAAQAQSLPRTRDDPVPAPRLSLRGSRRIVLWTASTAAAALLLGSVWYLSRENGDPAAGPSLETLASPGAAAAASDIATPDGAPVDPAAGMSAVVAGPLAPRNASLEQAAEAGEPVAQYELALQRLSAGRTQEGAALLRLAADGGFPMAQYRLAKLYERGEGVTADLTMARRWTERAAAAGNRRAMHDLGVYFARGEGAPRDEAAAFRWFRQAAELGVADSQYNLGVLYQQGRGVGTSASEALFWFLVAARQGDQDAAARAAAIEAQLPQTQVQQARARAQAFRARAASGDAGSRARSGT